jgi:futalosine hydrolase
MREVEMSVDKRSECFALMAALPSEGNFLLSHLRVAQTMTYGDLEIIRGILHDKEVLVVFSGLGKINAAAGAAAVLAQFSVSRFWMWGSAGAYPHSDLRLNDVALASEEILGDEGVLTSSSWKSLDAIGIPLAKNKDHPVFNRIPADKVQLKRARLLLNYWQATSSGPRLHVGHRFRGEWQPGSSSPLG